MLARPRFHTEASEAPNQIDRLRQIGDDVGMPLLPWTDRALAVWSEYEATDLGDEPLRRTGLFTVPRQSSKSTSAMVWLIERATRKPDQYGILMAQNRLAATNRLKDLVKMLSRAGIAHKATFGVGNERCTFGNGTVLQVLPPTENAAHGESVDFALLDEVFAIDPIVVEGVLPAMSARPEAQLLYTSTAGTLADSHLLNGLTEAGREEPDGEMMIADYGVPEGVHPLDEEHWHEWHPGLGYTATVKHLRSEAKRMRIGQWTRAYGNVATSQETEVIPGEWWLRSEDELPVPKEITLALDASPFGGTIAASFTHDNGRHVDLVEHRAGDDWSWMMPRVIELCSGDRDVLAIALDAAGLIGYLAPELKQLALDRVLDFRSFTQGDRARASHYFYDQLRDGHLTHGESEVASESLATIGSQTTGDLWRFSRKRSVGDPAPIIAMSMALYAHNEAEQKPSPAVHFV